MKPRQPQHRTDDCVIHGLSALIFAPLAWLKLQYMLHAGPTEVGGFGISSPHNQLYVEDFVTVRQDAAPMYVHFDDTAVAGFFDQCVDEGMAPERFGRIWIHTHPGSSPEPSVVDEDTFTRVFGGCDWSVLFILSRMNRAYARLAFRAGPGGEILLPVEVDWADWPRSIEGFGPALDSELMNWQAEYLSNIEIVSNKLTFCESHASPRAIEPSARLEQSPGLTEDEEDWESFWEERHEQTSEAFAS